MIDDCDWTPTKLIHEIVADLGSIQGFCVELENRWPFNSGDYRVFVSTSAGQNFELEISISPNRTSSA